MVRNNKYTFYFTLKHLLCIMFFFFLLNKTTNAQQDSCLSMPMVTVSYGFQFPSGDLSKRFGPNSTIGIGFYYKTNRNWFVGAQWNYLFSGNVREDSIYKNILTPEGTIIDIDGKNGDYKSLERGHLFGIGIGKLFPVTKNKNSGIISIIYFNALQHKIRIQNNPNNIPQINYEYKQGYDHLTNGLGTGFFLGYMYMSESKYTNIYAGFDGTLAFTKNRRYNFNTSSINNNLRNDILGGIKLGIILPIYSKNTEGKYFYD